MFHFGEVDVLELLSHKIQAAMTAQNISQRKLALLTEQPLMTINSLVNGNHMPGFEVVFRVAQVLGISLDDLAKKTKAKKSRQTV